MTMEESIKTFTKTLASFCNHIQSSSDALIRSVDRRPVPLGSASSTFIRSLNRRVSSTTADLGLLESMSFETVSFEELLGYCSEVYKKNQTDVAELEGLLRERYGYVPEPEIDDSDEFPVAEPSGSSSKLVGIKDKSVDLEADPSYEDSLILQNLGLSDICLASLASDANDDIDIDTSLQESIMRLKDKQNEVRGPYQSTVTMLGMIEDIDGEAEDGAHYAGASTFMISISKGDYESLPSYMKSLASWEELVTVVEKMNSRLSNKNKNSFHQDELTSLELGPKGKSYLLLLVRMKRLVVENVDGQISYSCM